MAATIVIGVYLDGSGTLSPVRLIAAFSIGAMLFAVPGAIMLVGLRAILEERTLSPRHVDLMVIVAGAFTGFVILAVPGGWRGGLIGGTYGFATALALVLVRNVLKPRSGST